MQEKSFIFNCLDNSDEALAEEVAERADIPFPSQCIIGVAANARLVQHHIDTLRELNRDGR